MHNMPNLDATRLHQRKTTSESSPVRQQHKPEVTVGTCSPNLNNVRLEKVSPGLFPIFCPILMSQRSHIRPSSDG